MYSPFSAAQVVSAASKVSACSMGLDLLSQEFPVGEEPHGKLHSGSNNIPHWVGASEQLLPV